MGMTATRGNFDIEFRHCVQVRGFTPSSVDRWHLACALAGLVVRFDCDGSEEELSEVSMVLDIARRLDCQSTSLPMPAIPTAFRAAACSVDCGDAPRGNIQA
jgi:hypothetical protein